MDDEKDIEEEDITDFLIRIIAVVFLICVLVVILALTVSIVRALLF